jgi:hypothetical protein
LVYELEANAVDDEWLHTMVNPKGVCDAHRDWLQMHDVTREDIVIPLQDGDCVTLILGMAVTIRGVADNMDKLPASDGLDFCYREYASRAEGYSEPWSPPRMYRANTSNFCDLADGAFKDSSYASGHELDDPHPVRTPRTEDLPALKARDGGTRELPNCLLISLSTTRGGLACEMT